MKIKIPLLSIVFFANVAAGPETIPATQPTRITLHASPIGQPALKHRLLPDPIELTEGNAAILYLTASTRSLMIAMENPQTRSDLEAMATWLQAPAKEIDRARADHLLVQFSSSLRQMELGARREKCDWDSPVRIEGYATLLPYLQDMRTYAGLLALKARLAIIDGKYSEAAHALQTGFALARHLNTDGFLIQELVATHVALSLMEQVQFWIETPGSPNLYWPLTDLPSPFIDVQAAMRLERASAVYSIPHMKECAAGTLTGEQMNEVLAKLSEILTPVEGSDGKRDKQLLESLKTLGAAAMMLPRANTFLKEAGYTPQALGAMQPSQAIGLWWSQSYDIVQQEMTKSFGLPLHQALQMAPPESALNRSKDSDNPFLSLLPSITRARLTAGRLERRIAELRALEVIRAYAAANAGKFPENPGANPETPAPLDPFTGAPISYRAGDGALFLDMPLPPGGQAKDARIDEVRLAK